MEGDTRACSEVGYETRADLGAILFDGGGVL